MLEDMNTPGASGSNREPDLLLDLEYPLGARSMLGTLGSEPSLGTAETLPALLLGNPPFRGDNRYPNHHDTQGQRDRSAGPERGKAGERRDGI